MPRLEIIPQKVHKGEGFYDFLGLDTERMFVLYY